MDEQSGKRTQPHVSYPRGNGATTADGEGLAERLLRALDNVQRICACLHVNSASRLRRLHQDQAHQMLGFSSFGDFGREILGLAPGTMKDRLKLDEAFRGSPLVASSLLRAELSESKAIALLPVLRQGPAPSVVEQWLKVANDTSVRQLRGAVRESLHSRAAADDAAADEEQEAGRSVSFCGPVPVVRMFDEAMTTARKVLGFHAPRYRCVEALLAETSSQWQRLDPTLEEKIANRMTDQSKPNDAAGKKLASAPDPPGRGLGSQIDSQSRVAAPPTDPPNRGTTPQIERPSRNIGSRPGRPELETATKSGCSSPVVPARLPDSASLARAARTVQRIEEDLTDIEDLIASDPATHRPPPQASSSNCHLPDLRGGANDLRSGTDGLTRRTTLIIRTEIERVVACERLDAPLRIYRAEIFRELHAIGAMAAWGCDSWADFAGAYLGMSERAARALVAEGRLFATEAGLSEAYGRGDISLGKAFLLRRIVGGGNVPQNLDRAEGITHRQLEREVHLIEWARKVGARLRLGLDAAFMESSLMLLLTRWGWTRERVHALLESTGLSREAQGDPAVDPGVMTRLERLIDLLILTIWDEPPQPDDLDPAGRRTSTHASAMAEVRFWAPEPIAADWKTALGRVRAHNGVRCPPWAAVSMLVAEALQEWQRQDPARIPTQERILLRDGYRCIVPGCSSMHDLEVHHLEFLSAGGSDEDWNKGTFCHGHHRQVHDGIIRVRGRAPNDLYWELGCSPDGPPLLRLKGNRILWNALDRRPRHPVSAMVS